jgi:hypothetical protein
MRLEKEASGWILFHKQASLNKLCGPCRPKFHLANKGAFPHEPAQLAITLSIHGYTDTLAIGYPMCRALSKNLSSIYQHVSYLTGFNLPGFLGSTMVEQQY